MDKKKGVSLQKYSISDRNFLNKKLQTSTRYAKVKSKIDSGFNESRRQEIEMEMRKYYKVKSDEVFRRISLVDLLALMLVYTEDCMVNSWTTTKRPAGLNATFDSNTVDVNNVDAECSKEVICPFLILDVRSEAEFCKGHLATAVCYPNSKLSQAFNWETAVMLHYKNHPEWIIVICDANENLSPGVATTMIHRGYSNAFVLSGGLKLVEDKIGPPLVTTDEAQILCPESSEFLFEILSSTLMLSKGSHVPLPWWQTQKNESEDTASKMLITKSRTKSEKEDN